MIQDCGVTGSPGYKVIMVGRTKGIGHMETSGKALSSGEHNQTVHKSGVETVRPFLQKEKEEYEGLPLMT